MSDPFVVIMNNKISLNQGTRMFKHIIHWTVILLKITTTHEDRAAESSDDGRVQIECTMESQW